MSDVDKAMALAVAAAEQLEDGGGGAGGAAAAPVKGPTGPPRQSLARPKVGTSARDAAQTHLFMMTRRNT